MRPTYHFTAKKNWLSDPNGLVHDGQQWHMFYQYNPNGEDWGDMSWGHAVSADLAVWQEREPALLCDAGHMVFSGSAVTDQAGTAGFGEDAMIAFYTAHARQEPALQTQALAWSNDLGETWTRYASNPVLDAGLADFRDPYVFRHDDSDCWIMVVVRSMEQVADIYRSTNLRDWRLASQVSGTDAPGQVWECPTLVELPVRGQNRSRWLFKVDALHDAPGSGALYQIGSFDGHGFRPETRWRTLDHGRDFYAAIAWNGPRDDFDRPAWIGWMGNHAYQHRFPKKGWRGVMSLPRRLELIDIGGTLQLAQTVEPSIQRLFAEPFALEKAKGSVPIACRIELAADFQDQINLSDGQGSRFSGRAEGAVWHLRRSDEVLPFLEDEAQLPRRSGSSLNLWIDSETIEIISDDGTQCASFQHRPASEQLSLTTDCAGSVSIAPLR